MYCNLSSVICQSVIHVYVIRHTVICLSSVIYCDSVMYEFVMYVYVDPSIHSLRLKHIAGDATLTQRPLNVHFVAAFDATQPWLAHLIKARPRQQRSVQS